MIRSIRGVHSVETPLACKRVGGDWVDGACILMEEGDYYTDMGMTAPIKGGYLWYVVSCMDDDGWFSPEACQGNVAGCLIKEKDPVFNNYPESVGWCTPFYDEYIPNQKYITDVARRHMCTVARDIIRGRAGRHGLAYFMPDGRRVDRPVLNSVIGDRDGSVFKDVREHIKPFSFRRKELDA